MQAVRSVATIQQTMLPLSSGQMMMEAAGSYQTSAHFYEAAQITFQKLVTFNLRHCVVLFQL